MIADCWKCWGDGWYWSCLEYGCDEEYACGRIRCDCGAPCSEEDLDG